MFDNWQRNKWCLCVAEALLRYNGARSREMHAKLSRHADVALLVRTVDVSHEPQCRIDNGAHSFILGILAHETATALWESMCSALTSQRISHFSRASALFEIYKVHGLKIYNTKTSVLHLKKSRQPFYSPLFFLYSFAFAANAKDTFWATLDFCCCNTMCDHWGKSACL